MPSVVVYGRISTHEGRQHLATQLHACREFAIKRGYKVTETYTDEASATDYRRRTAWRRMLADLERWQPRQRPKAIIAFALDRVIRSVRDYVDTQDSLRKLGVAFVTIDGTTGDLNTDGDVYRDLQLNILAAFAQFERDLIRKRVQAGVDRARAENKHLGRPQTAIDAVAWANLPPGLSLRQRAAALGVSRSTLGRAERSGVLSQNPPDAEGEAADTSHRPQAADGRLSQKEMISEQREHSEGGGNGKNGNHRRRAVNDPAQAQRGREAAQCQPRYGDQTGEHREAPRASHFLQGDTRQRSGLGRIPGDRQEERLQHTVEAREQESGEEAWPSTPSME